MVWTNPCVDILGSISATKKRSFCVADWENRRTPATGTTSRSSSVEEKCQWVPIRWKGHRRRRARRMSSLAEDWGAAFLLLRGFTVYRFPSQKKKEHDIRVPDICQGIEILDGFHSPPQILEPFGAKVCARPRLQSQYDCDLPAWWVPERTKSVIASHCSFQQVQLLGNYSFFIYDADEWGAQWTFAKG